MNSVLFIFDVHIIEATVKELPRKGDRITIRSAAPFDHRTSGKIFVVEDILHNIDFFNSSYNEHKIEIQLKEEIG